MVIVTVTRTRSSSETSSSLTIFTSEGSAAIVCLLPELHIASDEVAVTSHARLKHGIPSRRRVNDGLAWMSDRADESLLQVNRLRMRVVLRDALLPNIRDCVVSPRAGGMQGFALEHNDVLSPVPRAPAHAHPALIPGDEIDHVEIGACEPRRHILNKMEFIDPQKDVPDFTTTLSSSRTNAATISESICSSEARPRWRSPSLL